MLHKYEAKFENIAIIGVPLDLGAGHRGVDAGPSAFRIAGIVEKLAKLGPDVVDMGNVLVPIPQILKPGNKKQKFLKEITEVCELQRLKVLEILEQGSFPLVLGGDHSVAIGTIAAISEFYKRQQSEIGLIWFDAHGDMNTPDSTPSGNIHGMPLAVCLGQGNDGLVNMGGFSPKVRPENVVLIGIRDVDNREKEIIRQSGVHAFTMTEIDELGMPEVIRQTLAIVSEGTAGFHLSFDLDGLDPSIAPGVGTPSRGGVNYREAHLFMEKIATSGKMIGLEMVELNPIVDIQNQSAEFGIELLESALGKRIL